MSLLTPYRINLVLMILALVYAFLAGLHTVWDFDMGWHLATGRYVVQHHAVPSTDVLSTTSPGAEWLYPPFAGVLLYGIFSAWGYAGVSWFCALATLAMAGSLLRRPSRRESGVAAALAILAVPALAVRAAPRADVFTTLFFSLFLGQLWSFQQSSTADGLPLPSGRRMRLWTLPLLMVLWVNLHPGFIAGLGLLFAYLLIEVLDLFVPSRRWGVRQRLMQAWPPLVATAFAPLLNPYGPRIFKASLHLTGLGGDKSLGDGPSVMELSAVPMSLTNIAGALEWRNPSSSFWWLVLAAVAVIALAFWRRQFGAGLLMVAALYVSLQHLRYQALFSIVVVVIGSTNLAEALTSNRSKSKQPRRLVILKWLPVIAASALCLLTCVRIADLVPNRTYIVADSVLRFGPGESWWFPERAAAFIERERLPGNILQDYNLGGFTAWRLGPKYGDFIDGRNVNPAVWTELQEFLSSPADSEGWEKEADRRNINVLFFSLARFYGVGSPNPMSLCQSKLWRPVYMDEVSVVLLRNRPENRPWIDRYDINCSTQSFSPPLHASRLELSNFYANTGVILVYLGRQSEAKEALERGEALSPEDAAIHLVLAQVYEAQQQAGDADREYKTALSLQRDIQDFWHEYGRFCYSQGRYADARPLIVTAAELATDPTGEYILLGNIDLALQNPDAVLIDFAKVETAARSRDPEVLAQIAEARAMAYFQLKDWQRAVEFQTEATRRTPEVARRWETLAHLCEATGQSQLAEQAFQRARALSK